MKEKTIIFLGEISIEFKRSGITYKEYIESGNKFIYARILKESNTNIRNLLLHNSFLLSEELQDDALKLINHYDIWMEKWNELYNKKALGLEDIFIFQNKHLFPRESEQKLMNKYNELKKEL
ncbi:MAG: hypothetical protein KAI79_12185 [Bacteroidales bacterium]|nr:hypothetical protein [Bacteroidales bacterium]